MINAQGRVAISLLFAILAITSAGAQAISVANDPLIAPPGADSVDIYIRTPPRPQGNPKQTLTLTDLTASITDRFSQSGSPQEVSSVGDAILWRTVWKLGANPQWNKSRHVLLAQWGSTAQLLNISVAREDEGPVRFSLSSGNLRTRYAGSVTIQALASYAIDNLEVQMSTLADSRTGRMLDKTDFEIDSCPGLAPKTDGSSQGVVSASCLKMRGSAIPSGKYDGALLLGTTKRANLGSIQVTVYSTSTCAQALGVLCVFLGLLFFFVFSVVMKGYSRRLNTLLPAVRLQGEVGELIVATKTAAKTTGAAFSHLLGPDGTPGSLLELYKDLSLPGLKKQGYLPPIIPNPFSQPELSSDYRVFLTSTNNQVESLKLIVRWGVGSVVKTWTELINLGIEQHGRDALTALDLQAMNAGGPLQLLINQIQPILDTLENDIAQAQQNAAAGGAPPLAVFGPPVVTAQQITIQLEQLSAIGWALWAAITLLVGSCALVWFNDGFGIGRDYVQCFLWGVGFPAIAQGFGGLNATSAASALSLQIPR